MTGAGNDKTPDGGDHAGIAVHPPVLAAAALGAGLLLDWLWPLPLASLGLDPGGAARPAAGAVVLALGFGLAGWAALHFRAAGTELPTWRPSTALVAAGPYRWSRNPIYVALLLVLGGVALLLDSLWLVALLVPVWAALRFAVIAREEAYLERRFGDDYRRYKTRVRRWL
jgi:protein-S-isoprenylcysteine O-methyltransferase Ste14